MSCIVLSVANTRTAPGQEARSAIHYVRGVQKSSISNGLCSLVLILCADVLYFQLSWLNGNFPYLLCRTLISLRFLNLLFVLCLSMFLLRSNENSREVCFRFYITHRVRNSGLTLELRVLGGIVRSGTLIGRILSYWHLLMPSWCRVLTKN